MGKLRTFVLWLSLLISQQLYTAFIICLSGNQMSENLHFLVCQGVHNTIRNNCEVLQGVWEFAQLVYMNFVDLEKAMDCVWGTGPFDTDCWVTRLSAQSALPAESLAHFW